MNQYTMAPSHRNVLIAFIAIGALCLGITWFNDDQFHSRFWSNLLHNVSFFTLISLMAAFFYSACTVAYAGWHTTFKRVWEAFSLFLVVGLVFMIILGLGNYMHWHHLYHWADLDAVKVDPILSGKASFLNPNWYFIGTVVFMSIWIFLVYKMRTLSLEEDKKGDSSFAQHRSLRLYAAIFLPIMGFTSAALIWQWIMSVDAHWYSTLFAWYTSASAFVSMIALTILILVFLKSKGYFDQVNANHFHDLGKYLFAISVFWTYLWFSQFMLIWYANIGEETIYFKERYNNYPVLFFANIAINFLVPFIILMRNDTKRKLGSLTFVSIIVLLGHWLDYFLMIKPGVLLTVQEAAAHHAHPVAHDAASHTAHVTEHTAEHVSNFVSGFSMPGLLEIGTFLGFLGLFLYFVLTMMTKSKLTPTNDPYLDESVHHHVI